MAAFVVPLCLMGSVLGLLIWFFSDTPGHFAMYAVLPLFGIIPFWDVIMWFYAQEISSISYSDALTTTKEYGTKPGSYSSSEGWQEWLRSITLREILEIRQIWVQAGRPDIALDYFKSWQQCQRFSTKENQEDKRVDLSHDINYKHDIDTRHKRAKMNKAVKAAQRNIDVKIRGVK